MRVQNWLSIFICHDFNLLSFISFLFLVLKMELFNSPEKLNPKIRKSNYAISSFFFYFQSTERKNKFSRIHFPMLWHILISKRNSFKWLFHQNHIFYFSSQNLASNIIDHHWFSYAYAYFIHKSQSHTPFCFGVWVLYEDRLLDFFWKMRN